MYQITVFEAFIQSVTEPIMVSLYISYDKDKLTSASISVYGSSPFAILQKIQVSSKMSSEESCSFSQGHFISAILAGSFRDK